MPTTVLLTVTGHDVVLRSFCDVSPHLRDGALVQILPAWRQEASVWVVWPSRLTTSAKVRVCAASLEQQFALLNLAHR